MGVPELVATAREAVLNPPNPWSGPRPHPQLGPDEGRPLFNTGVLLITLLVPGIVTSLAAMQKGQRDAESRLELERRQVATELSLLKAQINPHFFFNTLDNSYALTLLDANQARAALHRLSRMMRYVLYESPAGKFLRIHRSYIVGLGHIQSMGRGTVQIAGETLPVSDGYREAFDQFFSHWK